MAEARNKSIATDKFLLNNPFCCFCGGIVSATSRDHYPPIAIFDGRQRPDDLVVPACCSCNSLSSDSDLIVAAIARWRLSDTDRTRIEDSDNKKFARGIARRLPHILEEWFQNATGTQQKRARHKLADLGVPVTPDNKVVTLGPKTIPHLHLFAYKLTLALYFATTGSIIPSQGLVRAFFRIKEDLYANPIPSELLYYLSPSRSLRQGSWSVPEQFQYRYATDDVDSTFQTVATIRNGLVIVGFAITNPELADDTEDKLWITPPCLKDILRDPRFERRI